MTTPAQCKNCGAELDGAYCRACGQAADVGIPSLGRLFVDALGDLYNFDSRLWRSMHLLLAKPGELTREYLEGRRARYVPPFRMYVVLSVIFFLLAALPGSEQGLADGSEPAPEASLLRAPAVESDAAAARDSAAADPDPDLAVGVGIWTSTGLESFSCNEAELEGVTPEWRDRFEEACEKIMADSGASFARALYENIPLMMLLFIPIVASLMRVLYPLARRKYVEHLLFVVHFHAFFFLLASIGILISQAADFVPILDWPVTLSWVAGWIYLPTYLFVAMRRVYGQGRFVTTLKYVLLGGGYLVSLLATVSGVVLYTMLTL